MSKEMPEPILPPEGLRPEDKDLAQRAYRMAKGIGALRQEMIDGEAAAAQKVADHHAMDRTGQQILQTLETDMSHAAAADIPGTNGHQSRADELSRKAPTSYQ